jgi:hypothetical protein
VIAGGPVNPDEFVENLRVLEPVGSPVFKVIARAFNDEVFLNLKPVDFV